MVRGDSCGRCVFRRAQKTHGHRDESIRWGPQGDAPPQSLHELGTVLLLLHLPAMSPEKLGQHFLTDASWQERIARAAHIDGGLWVEIGAGHGEMTTRLAQRASKVCAIELNRRTRHSPA